MTIMTKKKFSEYFLGKMDAKDEEDFLAECFSNDENSLNYEIAREDLIENQLRGNLSGEDQERFEKYFLSDPYHNELYVFSKNLREQLAANKPTETIVTVGAAKKSPFINILIPVGGLAAVLLAALLIWKINSGSQENQIAKVSNPTPTATPALQISPTVAPTPMVAPTPISTKSPISSPTPKLPETPQLKSAPLPIIGLFLTMTPKGGIKELLKIPKKTKEVNLQSPKPEAPAFSGYRVIIRRNEKIVWKKDFKTLPLNSNKEVEITVPVKVIINGEREFIIAGKNADGSIQELEGTKRSFTVVKSK